MCDPILVTLLKMQPHSSQPSRENATPSSGTSPLASYKEVTPPGIEPKRKFADVNVRNCVNTKFRQITLPCEQKKTL